jgi:hypothetical protein
MRDMTGGCQGLLPRHYWIVDAVGGSCEKCKGFRNGNEQGMEGRKRKRKRERERERDALRQEDNGINRRKEGREEDKA